MGKKEVVKKYQTARLDEWIGDYDSADKLYGEIEQSEEEFASFLKEAATQKKKEIEDKINRDTFSLGSPKIDTITLYIKDETECLFNKSNLELKLRKNNDFNLIPSWKYSVSIISKIDKDLKLEIRGFNPSGNLPNLYISLPFNLFNWSIEKIDKQPNKEQIDLLGIMAFSETPEAHIYLSIDKWGLLNGTAIARYEELGDVLFDINRLLFEISKLCW